MHIDSSVSPCAHAPVFITQVLPRETHKSPRQRMYTEFDGAAPRAAAAPSITSVRRTVRPRVRSILSKNPRNGSSARSPMERSAQAPSTLTTFPPSTPSNSGSLSSASGGRSDTPERSKCVRIVDNLTTPLLKIKGNTISCALEATAAFMSAGRGGGARDAATAASVSSHGEIACQRSSSRRATSG